jgi:hypothetical protein
MSDQDIPASGSRWEPVDGGPSGPVPQPEIPAATVPTDAAGPAPSRRRPRRNALAAAGVGLVLAGGLGGFAIGHAIAGTDVSDPATVTGPDGGHGGRPGPAPGADGGGTA